MLLWVLVLYILVFLFLVHRVLKPGLSDKRVYTRIILWGRRVYYNNNFKWVKGYIYSNNLKYVSATDEIDQQNVLYIYSVILFSLEKKGNSDTCAIRG